MAETNRHLNFAPRDIDLSWMVGRVVGEVTFREPDSWCFLFEAKVWIAADCPWRIIRDGRITLSSDDHGQKFGLPAHIDAAAAATSLLASASVSAVQLREDTADLLIDFVGWLRLEIIPLSSGYESWQWGDPSGESFFVQGGGNIVRYPKT
jgi:hypothetical protein